MKRAGKQVLSALLFSFPRHHLQCSSVSAARTAGCHTGSPRPQIALHCTFRLSGVIEISPLRGEASKPSFSEIWCSAEVARRLANGGVKKSVRTNVKNGELFEAARNGVERCKFSPFSE